MGILDKLKGKPKQDSLIVPPSQSAMAEMALNMIADGVIIIDQDNKIRFINPAALTMTGCSSASEALGIDFISLLRFENGEGLEITDDQNPLVAAVIKNESFSTRDLVLVTIQKQKTPVAVTLTPAGRSDKIITLRDITKELEEEGEQTEFISTASHEMRTPVASIEGYIGLALNPATATIDDRARQYLTEAHNASQHLGRLFRDLLDVTKLDDKRMKLQLQPVEMTVAVKQLADAQAAAMGAKKIRYSFGSDDEAGDSRIMVDQLVYAMIDLDFLREIMDNLIENAIKYTPEGGAIWVSVRGDGDKVLINVTDTGMGIAPDDLSHIFQKFYRVDNSQTRTIGGTGLGLYIVKERVEAMGGKVWAESAFGEGSTFYVTFPRISDAEYERQKQIQANVQAMPTSAQVPLAVNSAVGAVASAASAPVAAPVAPVAPTAPVVPAAPVAPAPATSANPVAPAPAIPVVQNGTSQNPQIGVN